MMPLQKRRSNLPLLRHRMTDEQRAGFAFALAHGARTTAVAIRANKLSLGAAIVSACREVGTKAVATALKEARNPEWSLCAIRYAPGITLSQRESLARTLTERWFDQARWALKNIVHLSDEERDILQWVVEQR